MESFMINNKNKIAASVLALTLITPIFCGCNIVTPQNVETTPPVIPDETALPTTTTTAETTEETTEPTAEERVIVKTPDGKTVIDTTYVRTIADVTPEMMTADYWVSDADNEILMTPEEILEFNYNNRAIIKAADNKTIMPHLEDFGDTFDGNILRVFLNDNANSIPKDPSKYYLNGNPTTAEYWQDLIALSNIENVPDTINVKYGFSTKRMTVRMFPTEDRVFESASDQYFDSLLYSECMPYMPVVVLHESTDGEYLYVVFDSFSAWVRKDAIALCKDRKDWEARQNPGQWLVVTEREIRLGNDPYSPLTTDLVLPMGTQMELVPAKSAPKTINQRTTYGNYVVKVPTRGTDGYIKDELVLIPVSDDVNAGYPIVGHEGDEGPLLPGPARLRQRVLGAARDDLPVLALGALELLLVGPVLGEHLHGDPPGEGVHHRCAYAVKTAGVAVGVVAELAARMELGKHHLHAGHAQLLVDAHGDAPAVVEDRGGPILI